MRKLRLAIVSQQGILWPGILLCPSATWSYVNVIFDTEVLNFEQNFHMNWKQLIACMHLRLSLIKIVKQQYVLGYVRDLYLCTYSICKQNSICVFLHEYVDIHRILYWCMCFCVLYMFFALSVYCYYWHVLMHFCFTARWIYRTNFVCIFRIK